MKLTHPHGGGRLLGSGLQLHPLLTVGRRLPKGGLGGNWRPRTHGVAPPPPPAVPNLLKHHLPINCRGSPKTPTGRDVLEGGGAFAFSSPGR